MNKIDLIIDVLENSKPTGTGWVHVHEQKHQAALAAARELKALKPVAWLVSDAQGRYATIRNPEPYGEEVYEPLYAAPLQKYCPSENNAAYEKGFVEGMAKQMHSSVERAVNEMVNLQMMQIKDGKMSYLKKPWQGLTDEDWENTPNTGKQGCERDVEIFYWIEQTLKDKNT